MSRPPKVFLPDPPAVQKLEQDVQNTMWTPLYQLPGSGVRHRTWMMRCRCGTEKTVEFGNYISGKSLSCGCYRLALSRRGLPRLPVGESSRNQLLLIYRRGAMKHGREFTLTKEQFLALTSSDCRYCGQAPHQILNHAKYAGGGNGAYIYNGIDRVDSSVGYIESNCVPCCRMCNYAKSDMTLDDFTQWLDGLVAFRSNRSQERAA